jgi:hypothetical protein
MTPPGSALTAVLLALVAACSEPGRHQPEALACAEGWVADGEVCVPEECGTGRWGDLPVDEATVYVDAAATEGGDGSAEVPLRSIQPALDLAGDRGDGLVAVAAGTYAETLALTSDHAGVHLAGRCRELVFLTPAGDPAVEPCCRCPAGPEVPQLPWTPRLSTDKKA